MMSIKRTFSGYLLLEDGALFPGELLFESEPVFGEAVFNTSASGYQEILSDPSYCRQIMVFTTAHIGNVGVNDEDMESDSIQAAGMVCRNMADNPRNWRSQQSLVSWMETAGIPILNDVDTRAVTLHIREFGAMRAGIFSGSIARTEALTLLKRSTSMEGADLASVVTCKEPYQYQEKSVDESWCDLGSEGKGLRIGVMDFGVKRNILRELSCRSCEVHIVPSWIKTEQLLEMKLDGVLLSNGPGDPAAVSYAIDTIRELMGKLPLFGICLGHQLLALAAGLKTYKLPFGHRGANHPVRRESDGVVEITSQNHGFAVSADQLTSGWRVTHMNLNDNTVEGLEHEELPMFSVQYHPEASPGPHDSLKYFERFISEIKNA